ncbi:MAG: double-strand break repair protein AddB [Candidatus Phaeomarinobacter sp.]
MGQVFTIPPHVPFLPALAEGLLARGDALAATTVLVPTRRAARSLVEALLAQSETDALLLPEIRPLGDVDEEPGFGGPDVDDAALTLPPAIDPMHRTLALAQFIAHHAEKTGLTTMSRAQAIALAGELASLMDTFAAQDVPLSKLHDVVHDTFADHWQQTLQFLEVITVAWPQMLDTLGLMDPARRRADLIKATCARWQERPPGPIVAAGSTGSLKATADMLTTIAGLDEGIVVLPGLDQQMDDAAWAACEPAHPQFGLRLLLSRMGRDRQAIKVWDHGKASETAEARTRLVSEAQRPAETTDQWKDADVNLSPLIEEALDGLTMVSADNPQLESLSIALALRETLETPGRTAALVTPDRSLARRVASDLARWGIVVDDSGGQPLAHTRAGGFLLQVAEMLTEQLAPVPLLTALRHPLARGGMEDGVFHGLVDLLDKQVLRGPRPAPGLEGLAAAIEGAATRTYGPLHEKDHARARSLHAALSSFLGTSLEVTDVKTADFSTLVEAHLVAAEALAATNDEPGAQRLWSGASGEAASTFMAEIMEQASLLGDIPSSEYPSILGSLMAGRMVRPVRRSHARLQILGPLEARLQHVDRLVLGGLNEGIWPQRAETGAWINRPMRAQLGLEAPERLIGLAAHDVAQGLGTGDVILTRAERADGQPTVPSRWWLRLENLVGGLPHPEKDSDGKPKKRSIPSGPWLAMARELDRPVRDARQIERPAPKPPVEARPTRLSVTRINALFRDPYEIYAGHVLGLSVLGDLDADAGARDRGDMIHKILELFSRRHPPTATNPMPANAYAKLVAIANEVFEGADSRPAIQAIWYPRFLEVAEWFLHWEAVRRTGIQQTFVELKGEHTVVLPTRPFTLSGIADRIDLLEDGSLAILDYKTGPAPTPKQTTAKFSVQLPLEAAMARGGAFLRDKDGAVVGPDAALTSELAYVELKTGKVVSAVDKTSDVMTAADAAMAHMVALLTQFEEEDTPYISRPRPQFLTYDGDYDHLARVKEWQTATDTD